MANKRIDEPTGTETVGHEWDGIEELDTPMPRWWLITLYITIAWGVVYVVLYPAWPMVSQALPANDRSIAMTCFRVETAELRSLVPQ